MCVTIDGKGISLQLGLYLSVLSCSEQKITVHLIFQSHNFQELSLL